MGTLFLDPDDEWPRREEALKRQQQRSTSRYELRRQARKRSERERERAERLRPEQYERADANFAAVIKELQFIRSIQKRYRARAEIAEDAANRTTSERKQRKLLGERETAVNNLNDMKMLETQRWRELMQVVRKLPKLKEEEVE